MLKIFQTVLATFFIILIVGCNNQEESNSSDASSTEESASSKDENNNSESTTETENGSIEDDSEANDSKEENEEPSIENSSEPSGETTEGSTPLDAYSTEEIEYARIYLQFGPNPEIEELYIEHITAGTQINPLDDGSVDYPEDVVQLAGSRLVDGAITYSSNGDGTINLYNVPKRWVNPDSYNNDSDVMQEETQEIINNTETVYVEPGNDAEVAEMASRIKQDSLK